jgi:ABC-type cobalamin/Fe3+-siderophores transport system ATPase subunit
MNKKLEKYLNEKLETFIEAIIREIVIDIPKKFFNNLRLSSLKKLFLSNERIAYILNTAAHLYFLLVKSNIQIKNNPIAAVILFLISILSYFIYRSIVQEIREEYFRRRYSGFSKKFDNKAKIINKTKDENNIIFTVYTYIPRDSIISKIKELENYLNTNILEFKIDKYNKRLLEIITCKNTTNKKLDNTTLENKLINILNSFGFNAKLKQKESTNFFDNFYIDCNVDTKKVINKLNDIEYKLNIESSRLEIKVEKGVFIFQIKKETQTIYYFVDYIDKVKVDKKLILPVLLGMNQNTSSCIVEDIHDIKHMLIIGMNGSGKSSTLNSLLQSSMYFHGSTYSTYIMYDHKKTELNQYRNFSNTTYLNTTEQLLKSIIELEKIMEDRGKLFDKENVKDIKKYNIKFSNKKLPFIYLVIDEFSAMMKTLSMTDQAAAKKTNDKLINMVNLSRFAGIRLIISTQKPTGSQVDTDIVSQLHTKLIHRITKSDKKVLMIEEDVHKLRTGEFILETENYTEKMKGLFIDDEKDKYNRIYEILKKKYTTY